MPIHEQLWDSEIYGNTWIHLVSIIFWILMMAFFKVDIPTGLFWLIAFSGMIERISEDFKSYEKESNS